MSASFGVHHIALVCKDMKETVTFYEKGLGMKLVAIFPMHGVDGAKHCFLESGNGMQLSFVEFADYVAGTPGVSYSPQFGAESPVTTMHHLAFKASTLDDLKALRKSVKLAGAKPSPIIDHNFVHSFYFFDPNNFQMEVTCDVGPYTAEEYQLDLLDRKLRKGENDSWNAVDAAKKAAKL